MPILRRTKTRTICRVRPVPKRKRGAQFEYSSFFIACFPSVFRTGAWVAFAGGVRVLGGLSFFCAAFQVEVRPLLRGVVGLPDFSLPYVFRTGAWVVLAGGVRVSFYRRGAADGALRSATGGWSFRRAMCDEKSVRKNSARFFLDGGFGGLEAWGISGASETEGPVRGRFLNPASGRVGPAGILSLRHRRPHRASRRTRLCRARKSTGRF